MGGFHNRGSKKAWEAVFFSTMWSIWLGRNRKVFQNVSLSVPEIVELIKLRALSWVLSEGPFSDISSGRKDASSHNRNKNFQQMLIGSIPILIPMSNERNQQDASSQIERIELGRNSSGLVGDKLKQAECRSASDLTCEGELSRWDASQRITQTNLRSEKNTTTITISSQLEKSNKENIPSQQDESYLPTQFGKKGKPAQAEGPQSGRSNSKNAASGNFSDCSKSFPMGEPFDICLSGRQRTAILTDSLHEENIENWNELGSTVETKQGVVRPGMVLLKHYISHSEQVKIVKRCRELGLGPGGFYQPGYKDGAKLRLQMMCLGKNWDPQTRKYRDRRPADGIEPPGIPHEFSLLVKTAIQDAHDLIKEDFRVNNVEDILPSMSPDICIANFYTASGKLGLHQDRDESKESLDRGLPVVSISIGDSAEFLYGDQRNVNKAEKVVLESGDVLIFGGNSRHIFHGVPSIISNSAPKALVEEANLRPGRLNLTFRQF